MGIFIPKESSNKKSALNINQSSRQKTNKFLKETNNKNKGNKSTIDIKSNKNNNVNKIKTQRNSFNKKIKSISIDKTIPKKKEELNNNKYEITLKKNTDTIHNIIINYLGKDNTKVSFSKTGVKYLTKMYIGKKKIELRLNLNQAEKNKSSVNAELIEGDLKDMEKIFSMLKDRLK